MVQEFITYVKDQSLFSHDDKILLTVSGGIDSVAMLHCFKEAAIVDFGVAHCNFGLRGSESDEDELFVQKLAKRAKVSFHTHSFDTEAFAVQEKISIQMAARQLRYSWFQNLIDTYGYNYIATAHHRNDSIETVFFNLIKGTGIAGLHGISPKSGKIVRPILFADKEMIMDFVAQKQLSWREDSSNESIKYARNAIRHDVIPIFKKINPDLENTFQQTMERLREVEAVFNKKVATLKEEVLLRRENDIYLSLDKLKNEEVGTAVFWELIKEFGFNYAQSKEVFLRMFEGPGKVFDSATYRLNVDREYLIISSKLNTEFFPSTINEDQEYYEGSELKLTFSTTSAEQYKITSNKRLAALDFELLKFPLEIRRWRHGDVFFPLGMKKKKKISDFMIDEKIPLNLKERVFVLTSNNKIVWIVGYRIDDRYKITENTKTVFRVQMA